MFLTENFGLSLCVCLCVCVFVCVCVCHPDCDEMARLSNTALTFDHISTMQHYQDDLNPDPNPVDQSV